MLEKLQYFFLFITQTPPYLIDLPRLRLRVDSVFFGMMGGGGKLAVNRQVVP